VALNIELKRGDVIRVSLNPVVGSEQGGERPALIVSPDPINRSSPVILVASITSKKVDRVYPFETLIEPPDGGLSLRSKVMLTHMRSIDKSRVCGHYGSLKPETMLLVEGALKIATGLTKY